MTKLQKDQVYQDFTNMPHIPKSKEEMEEKQLEYFLDLLDYHRANFIGLPMGCSRQRRKRPR